MKELEVKRTKKTKEFLDELKVYAFQLEPGDSSEKIDEYLSEKYGTKSEQFITKETFHDILDKVKYNLPQTIRHSLAESAILPSKPKGGV